VRLATGGLAGFITGLALGYIFFVVEMALLDRRRDRALAALGGGSPGGPQPGPQGAKNDVGGNSDRKGG
jgi:hypothetical protein